MTTVSDDELMLRLREGDLDSVGTLYLRHYDRVYALCSRLTSPDSSLAEDLTQETFIRVIRYRHSFEGRSAFTTWLYRIARNLCLEHIRTGKRRDRLLRSQNAGGGSSAQAREPTSRRLSILEAGLQRLPAKNREALVLSRFPDLRYAEIAEILGCSVGAIKTRVHRALKELAEICHAMEREENAV